MSLPEPHLDEAALIDEYFRDPDAVLARPAGELDHLAGCPSCRRRFTELSAAIDAVRVDVACEADQVFTADRLHTQLVHIMRRLEHAGRPGRVLTFPVPASRRHLPTARPRVATRWVAAAAVVGLLFGLGAGRLAEVHPVRARMARNAFQTANLRVAATDTGSAIVDDAFLSQVDAAVDQHRIPELSALDELTPSVHEAALPLR